MSDARSMRQVVAFVEGVRRGAHALHPMVRCGVSEILAGEGRCCTCAMLARRVGCTDRTLRKWFVAELGIGPNRFQRRWAIVCSLRLLVDESHAKLDVVASRVGYASNRALARAWLKEVGTTPAAAAAVVREKKRECALEGRGIGLREAAIEVTAASEERMAGRPRGGSILASVQADGVV